MNKVEYEKEITPIKEQNDTKLVIVQQNVRGRDIHNGVWSIQDYKELIKEVKGESPDIIFLTEFYYQQMYGVTKKILEGYDFIKPIGLSEDDEKDLYAACILAIKRTKVTKDNQFELENMLIYRYICVDLKIEDKIIIKTLLMYVPQTYKAKKSRVEQKRKMLCSASKYIAKNCDNLLFVGGDMNSDIDGKTTTCIDVFEQIYKKMIDTDCKKETTWEGKRLDYALVSRIMQGSVKTIPIKTKSDHKGLKTVYLVCRSENSSLYFSEKVDTKS